MNSPCNTQAWPSPEPFVTAVGDAIVYVLVTEDATGILETEDATGILET